MRQPSYRALIVFPVVAYLVILLCVAVFVTRPSTLGWIGFAVAAALALLIAGLAVALFPRSRTNARREHPGIGDPLRMLVVADADCGAGRLRDALLDRGLGPQVEIAVVAPVLASPLRYLTESEADERARTRLRLDELVDALACGGLAARGIVGADDPLLAIGDALAAFPASEILLVANDEAHRGWLEHGIERAARDAYGVPVATIAARGEALVS